MKVDFGDFIYFAALLWKEWFRNENRRKLWLSLGKAGVTITAVTLYWFYCFCFLLPVHCMCMYMYEHAEQDKEVFLKHLS